MVGQPATSDVKTTGMTAIPNTAITIDQPESSDLAAAEDGEQTGNSKASLLQDSNDFATGVAQPLQCLLCGIEEFCGKPKGGDTRGRQRQRIVPCFMNAPLSCFRRGEGDEPCYESHGFRCCFRVGNFTVILERESRAEGETPASHDAFPLSLPDVCPPDYSCPCSAHTAHFVVAPDSTVPLLLHVYLARLLARQAELQSASELLWSLTLPASLSLSLLSLCLWSGPWRQVGREKSG